MEQFIVNKLDGGFIVQTVVDGQQTSQKIIIHLDSVADKLWGFFGGGAVADEIPWEAKAIKAAGPVEGKEIPF